MAKQSGLLTFTGKLGNVIGYRRNGIHFVRSMPVTVKQTVATRAAAHNFGIASRKGKLIRRAIAPLLDIHTDGGLVNRLNKALITAGRDRMSDMEGFRLNKHTGVEHFFDRDPVLTSGGMLKIPAQEFPPQDTATHLVVKVVAVRIHFMERRVISSHTSAVMIDLGTPFEGAELEATVPGKGTLLLVLEVTAYKDGAVLHDRRLHAADIIRVVAPVSAKLKRTKATDTPDVKKVLPYVPRYSYPASLPAECRRE